jgi:hypothetical protein
MKFANLFGVILCTMKRKGSEDTVHGLVAKRDFGSFVLLQNLENCVTLHEKAIFSVNRRQFYAIQKYQLVPVLKMPII